MQWIICLKLFSATMTSLDKVGTVGSILHVKKLSAVAKKDQNNDIQTVRSDVLIPLY